MSFELQTEADIREWKAVHAAHNEAWQSVIGDRTSPAIVGYKIAPPGKISNVRFLWSAESSALEAKAIKALEALGPADGVTSSSTGTVVEYWIGVPWATQGGFETTRRAAYESCRYEHYGEAERNYKQLLSECKEKLGEFFPPIARVHFDFASMYMERDFPQHFATEYESGLEILDRAYQRNPAAFVSELNTRLERLIKAFLKRDNLEKAQETLTRWEAYKRNAAPDVADKMQRSLLPFARFFIERDSAVQASFVYLEALEDLRKQGPAAEDELQKILLEAAKFFARFNETSRAQELYEELLEPYLELKREHISQAEDWLTAYKKWLQREGLDGDLARLKKRAERFEIEMGTRISADDAYGYIDKQGQFQIPRQYVNAKPFVDGVARVVVGSDVRDSQPARLIDVEGNDLGPDPNDERSILLPEGYEFHREWSRRGVFSDGLAAIRAIIDPLQDEDVRVGYVDEHGAIIIPPRFTDGEVFKDGFAIVASGGFRGSAGCIEQLLNAKYGLVDKAGRVVIEPQFSRLWRWGETGLFAFLRRSDLSTVEQQQDHREFQEQPVITTGGIITPHGKIIIELPNVRDQFHLFPGSDLVSVQWGEKELWGYIDASGEIALPAIFKSAYPFEGDNAPVRLTSKWGLIDRNGTFVVPPVYDAMYSAGEGITLVVAAGRFGCVDKVGKLVVATKYDDIGYFHDGFAESKLEGKLGLVSQHGIISEPAFDRVHNPKGESVILEHKGMKGMYAINAKELVSPRFADLDPMYEGLAGAAKTRLNGQQIWGFVDAKGAWKIPAQFEEVGVFSDGLAPVLVHRAGTTNGGDNDDEENTNTWGYIDKTGRMVIPPSFDSAAAFIDGFAIVGIGPKQNRFHGIINREGEFILQPAFRHVSEFSEGLAVVGMKSNKVDVDAIVRRLLR